MTTPKSTQALLVNYNVRPVRIAFLMGKPEQNVLQEIIVSAKRTPSCKDSRRIAKLRHDQALKESLDKVAKAGFRAGT